MSDVHQIVVPQLGVNDDRVRIVRWHVAAGESVQRGQPLAELETTKAAFELEAEASGYFYPLAQEGSDPPIRAVIGFITAAPDPGIVQRHATPQAGETPGPKLTAKARALALELNLDFSTIPLSGIIREEDIRRLARGSHLELPPAPSQGDAVVYGASQGGAVVAEAMRSRGDYRPVAFIDDNTALAGSICEGLPVWPPETLRDLPRRGIAGIATHITRGMTRQDLLERAALAGVPMLNVIHARAAVASTVRMGAGNLIKAGAVVDDYVTLGNCCIIDNAAVVPHHCRLHSGVHLAPGVAMGGDCEIGENAIIGVGARLAPRVKIGRNAIVGVGAVIARDLPDEAIAEGPAAKTSGTRKDT